MSRSVLQAKFKPGGVIYPPRPNICIVFLVLFSMIFSTPCHVTTTQFSRVGPEPNQHFPLVTLIKLSPHLSSHWLIFWNKRSDWSSNSHLISPLIGWYFETSDLIGSGFVVSEDQEASSIDPNCQQESGGDLLSLYTRAYSKWAPLHSQSSIRYAPR